ncbi:MAG: hypothetical protein HC842_01420, partial [Cytophagales bacterium]|nr:hypothetical protein [Cytophagales bacterium]
MYFGGNVGVSFGTHLTSIELSPLVGYRFTDRFSAGPGITYIYLSDKLRGYTTNIYGGRLFANYFITDNIFARSEWEALSLEKLGVADDSREWISNLFLGGGYFL